VEEVRQTWLTIRDEKEQRREPAQTCETNQDLDHGRGQGYFQGRGCGQSRGDAAQSDSRHLVSKR